MTLSDIRQIVSYLGAPYSMEVFAPDEDNPEAGPVWQLLEYEGANLLLDLFFIHGGEYPTPVRNFKLKLRRIAGLTDEEILIAYELFKKADPKHYSFWRNPTSNDIERGTDEIRTVDAHIFFDGTVFLGVDPIPTAEILSYLQSIAVFVPGTLNPDFVTLI